MDPNQWPPRVWLFMALLLGVLVASLGILIWAAWLPLSRVSRRILSRKNGAMKS